MPKKVRRASHEYACKMVVVLDFMEKMILSMPKRKLCLGHDRESDSDNGAHSFQNNIILR